MTDTERLIEAIVRELDSTPGNMKVTAEAIVGSLPEPYASAPELLAQRDELLVACKKALTSFRAWYDYLDEHKAVQHLEENKKLWPLAQLEAAIANAEKGE